MASIVIRDGTLALDARNQEMRVVLDNVEQGLLTVNASGCLLAEKSSAVEKWFGPTTQGQTFAEFLEPLSPKTALAFELSFDQLTMGILPVGVAIDQLPEKMTVGARHYGIAYTPVVENEDLTKLLIVISDVTALVVQARLEAEQREVMLMFNRLFADRDGFLEFLEEAEGLVASLCDNAEQDLSRIERLVHTLKGNAMLFGLISVSDECGAIEDALSEQGGVPTKNQFDELAAIWGRLKARLNSVIERDTSAHLEVSVDDYNRILRAANGASEGPTLVRMLADLRLEPTVKRLSRIGDQAKRIARRLGKGEIEVDVRDGGVRLDPERWSSFWSAFVHVVRNAVDHGLETADERGAAKKTGESGRLVLTSTVRGDELMISLEDDGRGIDWVSVRRRAEALGLPSVTSVDLERAILSNGLSTAQQVTEFSGRGVGMGAVKEACDAMGGTLAIRSTSGRGTLVEFCFPKAAIGPTVSEMLADAA